MTHWTLEPLQLVPSLLLAAVYAKRVHTLRERGTATPAWRIGLFGLGVLLLLIALVSPLESLMMADTESALSPSVRSGCT